MRWTIPELDDWLVIVAVVMLSFCPISPRDDNEFAIFGSMRLNRVCDLFGLLPCSLCSTDNEFDVEIDLRWELCVNSERFLTLTMALRKRFPFARERRSRAD